MEELQFTIGPFTVKAGKTEPRNNNIPSKFIRTFNDTLNSSEISVYNLTINGNGRFYYSPALNFIAIYFLGEFHIADDLTPYLSDLKNAIESLT
jgi:hypothetical protein